VAHHKSAIKRIKQTEKRNARNRHQKSTLKTYIKRIREAVENKDKEAALAALQIAIPVIDKTATKGVIHKTNASRNVSRLTRLVNTLG
jgi:small subunit ribosomal protein S20